MADKEIIAKIRDIEQCRPHVMLDAHGQHDAADIALAVALEALGASWTEAADLYVMAKLKGAQSTYVVPLRHAAAEVAKVAAALRQPRPGAITPVGDLPRQHAGTTHERLDDFVNSAVAEGRGMLKVASAELTTPTGETHDVAAYLKGETDDLPGGPLTPSGVRSLADIRAEVEVSGAPNDDVTGDEQRTEILEAAGPGMTSIDDEGNDIRMPKTWESDTMTADGLRPPGLAPTLGQPGDMGTGYSHAYVPPGGRAVTFAELLTPVPAASLPPHLSHSQGNTIGDCATKYRLQRVEALPQIPQWANIGGTAFHAAVEAFERTVAKMVQNHGPQPADVNWKAYDCEGVWKHHFEGQIQAVAATTTVPISVWRAARKGAEGEQWWRVNGPLMLRRYLDARPDEPSLMIGMAADVAIEWEAGTDVPTPYGPVPFTAKIDRVTYDDRIGGYVIRDYKTSYERPTDTTQLGDYAHTLILAKKIFADRPILGTYFDARRGEWTEPVDLLAAHPFEAFQYRVTTAHAQKLALTAGPTPARPSSYCGGCAVRYACPIMAAKS